MNMEELNKSMLEYNTPNKIDYKKVKVKRIKGYGGIVITRFYYNGRLILERL